MIEQQVCSQTYTIKSTDGGWEIDFRRSAEYFRGGTNDLSNDS